MYSVGDPPGVVEIWRQFFTTSPVTPRDCGSQVPAWGVHYPGPVICNPGTYGTTPGGATGPRPGVAYMYAGVARSDRAPSAPTRPLTGRNPSRAMRTGRGRRGPCWATWGR